MVSSRIINGQFRAKAQRREINSVSNVPTITLDIFRVAAFEKQACLPVTFLVQVVQQRRIGITRQLFRQFVNPRKKWEQIGF
jgi:hypothetical protein